MSARSIFDRFALAIVVVLMTASSAAAQPPISARELRVAVMPIPPLVMQENGSLTGFNIDLWNAIAARLQLKTDYQVLPDIASLLESMRTKNTDVVVSPIVITAARDQEFDFSLPTMQAGFQIMVRDTGEAAAPDPLADLLILLFSRTTALWIGIAAVLVLVPAHLVWLLEPRSEEGIVVSPKYIPGIFEAMYWAVCCLTTQAETMPHQWVVRTFSVFWMFAGVIFVSFYTAQLTTTLAFRQIRGAISGPEELPGRRIGTVANSTAVDYLRAHQARVQEFQTTDQMFQALLDKRVDAVVLGAPVLLYYATHEGRGRVKVVGPEFDVAPVAFTFQLESPLRKEVNGALLSLRENGTYQQLYDKWFGGS
ncbi:MAG: transporter substrate-binding domain-containing protein [Deltaproteobacteria bacterium]|nr:transporter substrate-binding domain-containing protein [Deltaproteobacteria bacterium]